MHEEFLRAGFYRMLVPRRYGGYEFDLPTFLRVIIEIARRLPVDRLVPLPLGRLTRCRSARSSRSRRRRRSSVTATSAAPRSRHRRGWRRALEDGWELNSTHPYSSGAPYSTHYMGQTFLPQTEPDAAAGHPALRRAPRPVDDARRLGRHARAEGQRLAQRPARERAHPRALRAREHVDGRHRRERRDTGVPAARQPDVRRAHAQLLPVRALRGDGRRREGRARGVRDDASRRGRRSGRRSSSATSTRTTSAGSAVRWGSWPRRRRC